MAAVNLCGDHLQPGDTSTSANDDDASQNPSAKSNMTVLGLKCLIEISPSERI